MAARKHMDEREIQEIFASSADENDSTDGDDSTADADYDPKKDADSSSSDEGSANTPKDQIRTGKPAQDLPVVNKQLPATQIEDGIRPTVRSHQRTGAVLSRKRKLDPSGWKSNVRKSLRQSGKQYINSRGNIQQARSVKTKKDCTKCKFKCSLHITDTDRLKIFTEFWTLDDNEKLHFFGKTTVQEATKQNKKQKDGKPSRKCNSLRYSFSINGHYIRVCKVFYLTTLDINHKRVSKYHSTKCNFTGTPVHLKWGEAANNVVPQEVKDGIRQHFQSIPKVESHYCRANTNKEYLPSEYNQSLLYDKYVQWCNERGKTPGKLHLYRYIFNFEYNLAFHLPKKDRCDTCEIIKQNKSPTDEEKIANENHQRGKLETKTERDGDRRDTNKFVVCFDLQKVFALPTADVSNFFYRRKLNVYHMTAHCSVDKKGYGAVWHEGQHGRAGNDIASAVIKVLHYIVNKYSHDPCIKHITMWSDSCIPQNRNSIFATSIKVFLKTHPQVHSIEQKFCEPGHSSIQEVDNLHSQIEHVCKGNEIYSPLGLIRMLKNVRNLETIIQMKADDFKDFAAVAQQGTYKNVPFTKTKSLLYHTNQPKVLNFKTSITNDWISVNVCDHRTIRGGISQPLYDVPDPAVAKPADGLALPKKADIKAMLKFMPGIDRVFMTNLVL